MRRRKVTFQIADALENCKVVTSEQMPEWSFMLGPEDTLNAMNQSILEWMVLEENKRYTGVKGWYHYPNDGRAIVILY